MIERDMESLQLLQELHKGSHMALLALEEAVKRVRDPGLREHLLAMQDLHKDMAAAAGKALLEMGVIPEEPSAFKHLEVAAVESLRAVLGNNDHQIADLVSDGARTGARNLDARVQKHAGARPELLDLARTYRERQEEQLIRLEKAMMKAGYRG